MADLPTANDFWNINDRRRVLVIPVPIHRGHGRLCCLHNRQAFNSQSTPARSRVNFKVSLQVQLQGTAVEDVGFH